MKQNREQIDAIEFLFGAYRRQVLGVLLARPERGFHVRELGRLSGVPVGSLHRELRALAEAGILLRTPVERQVRYQANRNSPMFDALALIFAPPVVAEPPASYEGTPRRQRVLQRLNVSAQALSALARRYGLKRMAFFGSVSREDFKPDSDVDVLVEFEGRRTNPFAKFDLADELSALFGGRNVDVVTPGVLTNPVRRASIERDLIPVHDAG